MLKISYAGCLGLSPVISAQFTLECVAQPEIIKNSLKPRVSISPGLGSVPGRDRQTDGRTELR